MLEKLTSRADQSKKLICFIWFATCIIKEKKKNTRTQKASYKQIVVKKEKKKEHKKY